VTLFFQPLQASGATPSRVMLPPLEQAGNGGKPGGGRMGSPQRHRGHRETSEHEGKVKHARWNVGDPVTICGLKLPVPLTHTFIRPANAFPECAARIDAAKQTVEEER